MALTRTADPGLPGPRMHTTRHQLAMPVDPEARSAYVFDDYHDYHDYPAPTTPATPPVPLSTTRATVGPFEAYGLDRERDQEFKAEDDRRRNQILEREAPKLTSTDFARGRQTIRVGFG